MKSRHTDTGKGVEAVVLALLGADVRQVEYLLGVPMDRRMRQWEETLVVRRSLDPPSGPPELIPGKGMPWVPVGSVAARLSRRDPGLFGLVKMIASDHQGLPPGWPVGLPMGNVTHLPFVQDGRFVQKWTLQHKDALGFVPIASAYYGRHFGLTICSRQSCARIFLATTRRRPALCDYCMWEKVGMPPERRKVWIRVRDRLRLRPMKEGRLSGSAAVAAARDDLFNVRDGKMLWTAWNDKWNTREGPQGRPAE